MSPIRSADGAVVGVSCIWQDISERKQIERELRENRATLHAALSSMTDAVFISDVEGKFVLFNEAFTTFHRFTSREQTLRSLEDYAAILDVSVVTGRDITEWKNAQAQLEQAQRLARFGSWTWNPNAEQVTWSGYMYELFGRDEALGDALLGYVHPGDREFVADRFRLNPECKDEFEFDFRIRAGDGQDRVLHAIGREDPSRPECYAGTFQDVTEQRHAEQAEAANRAKSEFLARMSHELRTPLNAIIGFAQVLELEGLAPRQSEDIGHVLRAGDHLLALVNDVLDLARIDTGELTMSPETVTLVDEVNETVALLFPLARDRNVSLHVNRAGLPHDGYVHAEPPQAGADERRLQRDQIQPHRRARRDLVRTCTRTTHSYIDRGHRDRDRAAPTCAPVRAV